MITAVQDNDVYIIRFQYDAELVKLVKNVPGRRYVPEHKYWTDRKSTRLNSSHS